LQLDLLAPHIITKPAEAGRVILLAVLIVEVVWRRLATGRLDGLDQEDIRFSICLRTAAELAWSWEPMAGGYMMQRSEVEERSRGRGGEEVAAETRGRCVLM
jgi:hypothetical protein